MTVGTVWKGIYAKNDYRYFVWRFLPYRESIATGPYGYERGDWLPQYFDGSDNQAFHFWYYVASSFYDDVGPAYVANWVHDPYWMTTPLRCGESSLEILQRVPQPLPWLAHLADGANM